MTTTTKRFPWTPEHQKLAELGGPKYRRKIRTLRKHFVRIANGREVAETAVYDALGHMESAGYVLWSIFTIHNSDDRDLTIKVASLGFLFDEVMSINGQVCARLSVPVCKHCRLYYPQHAKDQKCLFSSATYEETYR